MLATRSIGQVFRGGLACIGRPLHSLLGYAPRSSWAQWRDTSCVGKALTACHWPPFGKEIRAMKLAPSQSGAPRVEQPSEWPVLVSPACPIPSEMVPADPARAWAPSPLISEATGHGIWEPWPADACSVEDSPLARRGIDHRLRHYEVIADGIGVISRLG